MYRPTLASTIILCVGLVASQSSFSAINSVDRSSLSGRLFVLAVNAQSSAPAGQPLDRRLYVLPANGSGAPADVTSFRYVSGLVGYPPNDRLGLNVLSGGERGSYFVETQGATYQTRRALLASSSHVFGVLDWDAPSGSDTTRWHLDTQVVFSPDERQVAGVSSRGRLCIVPVDGGAAERCVESVAACSGFTPAWSPDGETVAFVAPVPGNLTACNLHEIFLANVSTLSATQLTNVEGETLSHEQKKAIVKAGFEVSRWHTSDHPAWSPDGSLIAFQSALGVATISSSGTNYRSVAQGKSPAWSPDGTMIAYRVPRTGGPVAASARNPYFLPWTVMVARADGSGAVEITTDDHSPLSIEEITWMP